MKKITKLKPRSIKAAGELDAEQLSDKLTQAMNRFADSPAYPSLCSLPLRVFAGDELIQVLGNETTNFADLVEWGPAKILELCNGSNHKVAELVQLLNSIAVDNSQPSSGSGSLHTLFARPTSFDTGVTSLADNSATGKLMGHDNPVKVRLAALSSIAAEQVLLDGQAKLKNHPRFKEFKEYRLRDFWPEKIPVAPFVEAFTFAQLASMPIENLLEKRSFSEQKVEAVIACISKVTNAYGQDSEFPKAGVPNNSVHAVADTKKTLSSKASKTMSVDLQAYALLLVLESEAIRAYWWGKVFLDALTSEQAVQLLLLQRLQSKDVGRIIDQTASQLERNLTQANKLLVRALAETRPDLFYKWQMLLKYAATPLSLFDDLTDQTNRELLVSVLKICIESCGGQALKIGKYHNTAYFTANKKLLAQIKKQLNAIPKSRKHKEALVVCRCYFPQLSEAELRQIVKAL